MPTSSKSTEQSKRNWSRLLRREWWLSVGGFITAITTIIASVTTVALAVPVLFPSKHVTPPVVPSELQRTPELALEFWSADQTPVQYKMYTKHTAEYTRDDIESVVVDAKAAPFEIHFPTLPTSTYGALQICAWTDDSIFNIVPSTDVTTDYESPFTPGKGLADTNAGSARLPLTNEYISYWAGDRVDHMSDTKDKIYISKIDDTTLTNWKKDLYLTLWIDRNLDHIIDSGEYEYVTVHFNVT